MATSDENLRTDRAIRVIQIDVLANGSGDATAYFPAATGIVHSLRYIKHGTNPYADTVDFTITCETTARGLWTQINQTASVTKFPRFVPDGIVGTALAALTVAERILLVNERIKVVLASAGADNEGSFEAVILPLHGELE